MLKKTKKKQIQFDMSLAQFYIGHTGIEGNEETDRLARLRSESEFVEPKPALGILVCLARIATDRWAWTQHQQSFDSRGGQSHNKLLLRELPSGRSGGTVFGLG